MTVSQKRHCNSIPRQEQRVALDWVTRRLRWERMLDEVRVMDEVRVIGEVRRANDR
jgi:hypothetical protein